METIGEKLKIAREYLGLTQEQVAKTLGISRNAIINIENNSRSVKSNELFKSLAEKFHLRGGGNPGMAQGGGTYDANILEELKIIVENL